ncbi:porin, partial [Mesorhizobium sp. 2RAF21]|uniref:porin n=1 Tax=Mesorhizobium sp. 2RAF21 TaxID=3232995 RepID=UPI003F998957
MRAFRHGQNRVICATTLPDHVRTALPPARSLLNRAARWVMSISKKRRAAHLFQHGDGAGNAVLQQKIPRPVFKLLTGGQKMNIKSLLLGSAAALLAVSGARAADAVVVAEPEPAEYVKICDVYGTA